MEVAALPVSSSAAEMRKLDARRTIVWALFLLSGFCGLVYEVLWCRHLGLLFGNTVQSMSAVLTAFMAGLALGSYVGGRVCERLRRPMMVYGILEVLIGLYCAFLPWAFGLNSPIIPFYRTLYGEQGGGLGLSVARFSISFVLLLIPTTMMGATLPVLSQFMVRSRMFLGRTVGALYAINSFGAVVGAALTGFVLLPMLGKANSNWVAVALNLILGVLAIVFGQQEVRGMQSNPDDPSETPPSNESGSSSLPEKQDKDEQAFVSPFAVRLTVLTFGITGFAAMATQIGWTRALSLAMGSSTYAFSLIVAIFILGLSCGGAWGSRAAATTRDPLALLGKILIAIGLGSLALTIILGFGPQMFFFVIALTFDQSWNTQILCEAVGVLLLIVGPTFLMGATMPLTMQVAARSREGAGRTVGTIYAINTVGSILGSFLGGLVLLPLLQIRGTLQLMAVLYLIPGAVLFFLSRNGRTRKPGIDFGIVIAALAASATVWASSSAWDPLTMSSGLYLLRNETSMRAIKERRWLDAIPKLARDKILYYQEGASSTVAVTEIRDGANTQLSLTVGGKPDASSGRDMSTQLGLALIPELFHPTGAKDVLVVGLGSGASVAAALAPKSVQNVDVVEMSPEVVEASYFFKDYTHINYAERGRRGGQPVFWPQQQGLNLIVNDGRNHLLLTSRKYDVIASEPSNPWLAGVGNLFTKEAFELTRSHLNEGGVMCQWIHRYSLEERDFFCIVKTFSEVYPQTQLWCVNRHDFLLIGSDKAPRIPAKTLAERLLETNTNTLLKSVNFDTVEEVAACFLSGDAELRRMTALIAPPEHTDDNMLLEFSAPKALYRPGQLMRATLFEPDPEAVVDLTALPMTERGALTAKLDLACAGREHMRCAIEESSHANEHWMAAELLSPHQLWVNEMGNLIRHEALLETLAHGTPSKPPIFLKFEEQARQGQVNQALAALGEFAGILQSKGEKVQPAMEEAVNIMRANGGAADALEYLSKNVISDPKSLTSADYAGLWTQFAELLAEQKKMDLALKAARHADDLAQLDGKATGVFGWMTLKAGAFDDAVNEFKYRCVLNPLRTDLRVGLAEALIGQTHDPASQKKEAALAEQRLRHARRAAREAAKLRDDDPAAWLRLSWSNYELAQTQPDPAFYRTETQNAWEHMVSVDKTGALRKGPRSDEKSEEFARQLQNVENTYRMEPKRFLELMLKLSERH